MTRAPFTPAGIANIELLLAYAAAGNAQADAWLRIIAEREEREGGNLPEPLTRWAAKPSRRRGRGRPSRAAAATLAAAVTFERLKVTAAWEARRNILAGMRTCDHGDPGPAFAEVAAWLASAREAHYGASAVRTWYYQRRAVMDRAECELAAIAVELEK